MNNTPQVPEFAVKEIGESGGQKLLGTVIKRFPPVDRPFPWHPPHNPADLRIGMLFEAPSPKSSTATARFRLSHFKIAAHPNAYRSEHAHPLEANYVSGSGVCGYWATMEEFCRETIITGYYPHRLNDSREEQYAIQARYETEHKLPDIAQQCLEAIEWEGWFTIEELRNGSRAKKPVPLAKAKLALKRMGAVYIQANGNFVKIQEWQPYGAKQGLFLYEVLNNERVIEHLNPDSSLAACGVQPGAWRWKIEPRYDITASTDRVKIRIDPDIFGVEKRTFFLDGIELGQWSCLRSIQEHLGGRWYGNKLCGDLGLNDACGGYTFECISRVNKNIAPYRIFYGDGRV